MLEPKEMAVQIARVLADKKCVDLQVLQITEVTTLADYFIIGTATSSPHLESLSEEVGKKMKEQGEMPRSVEGRRNGAWLLMDYGCVVVHLFMKEARAFYDLEHLWQDAEPLSIEGVTA